MFWKEKERRNRDKDGGPPCGQVRVLVVGDSGVGKTSLVHLITAGSAIPHPNNTVGCTVNVKHTTYRHSGSSSSVKGDTERDFFVELWDISGHERYKDCRAVFYKQINGVLFVHDLSQRNTKSNLQKWASEIALNGSFSAPLESYGPCGLPIPYLVIGNKVDIAEKQRTTGSSGNLVDAARLWVEKQGLLSISEELPVTNSFPANTGLISAAKDARFDKESILKFFHTLIRRRYFSDELPSQNTWSASPIQNSIYHSDEISFEDDKYNKSFSSSSEAYRSNTLPPLPAQRNLMPPPTFYPQQPVAISDSFDHQRFTTSEISNTSSKRSDINV
ncbi:putative GTP-binding protein [Zostera marina]|uniref:Putative GTP-binding protein n=1 Tax=Zostera marina TaxID=29655 RepID=A0A0K9PJH1_ZOSMR|nr:putative GTP-binding protein [Zostera marina]